MRASPRADRSDLAHNLIDFARLLRGHEFLASPAEVQDAMRAVRVIDLGDRVDFYLTLRTIFLSDPARRPEFDDLYVGFWGAWSDELAPLRQQETQSLSQTSGEQPPSQVSGESYSPTEVLVEKDFSDFAADELAQVGRACVAIARKVAMRKSRRYQPTHKGDRIDPRRSLRRSLQFGGTVLDLARLERKIRKPRIVLICDVSRSMEQYSVFLLQFIHSMQNVIGRIESFVFSTALHRVTLYFKHSDIETAIEDLAKEIPDWSGGTRIGESVKTFNDQFARRLVDKRTVVVILSDGLDTGQTEVLAEEMAELRLRAGRLIWLNPLLGKDDYQPLARGMLAALPHVDVFAAAHNLSSLQQFAMTLAQRGNLRNAQGAELLPAPPLLV